MVQILDPTDESRPPQRQLAARPEALSGTVGLLDISKPRGDVLIDRFAELITHQAPDITIKRYRKPTFTKPAPPALLGQIQEECDFVIEALAD